jgi:hypothetical protein
MRSVRSSIGSSRPAKRTSNVKLLVSLLFLGVLGKLHGFHVLELFQESIHGALEEHHPIYQSHEDLSHVALHVDGRGAGGGDGGPNAKVLCGL